ncbi:hypothetical protein Tco_0632593 [Tanacetum coccineum]
MDSQRSDLLMGDRMNPPRRPVWMVEEEGPMLPRGLCSFDRIEPGYSSGASDPVRDHDNHRSTIPPGAPDTTYSFDRRQEQMVELFVVIREMKRDDERPCRLSCFGTAKIRRGQLYRHGASVDLVERSDKDLSPRGNAMTLGIYSSKKMTNNTIPQGRNQEVKIELWNLKGQRKRCSSIHLTFQKNLRTLRGKQSDNIRGSLMISSRNDQWSTTQPSRRQNVRQSLQHGDVAKGALWGILAQVQQLQYPTTMARATRVATSADKLGTYAREYAGIQRDCPKLKNKYGGTGNAQGWVYAVGKQKRGLFSTDILQEEDDKSKEQIRTIPIAEDVQKCFPEDCQDLPPSRRNRIDYRELNNPTVKNRYPPRGSTICFDQHSRIQYYIQRYDRDPNHQALSRDQDRPKTAFQTNRKEIRVQVRFVRKGRDRFPVDKSRSCAVAPILALPEGRQRLCSIAVKRTHTKA